MQAIDAPAAIDAPIELVFPVRRFSVAEYEQIGRVGILTEDDSVELLEGLIVEKMTKNPRHDAMIDILMQSFARLLPLGWFPRAQNVLITSDSAPEPDVVIVQGDPQQFWNHHPTAAVVPLVIEVAETSLQRDRRKRRIYARAAISQYWIVNLISDQLEMFAEPDPLKAEYMRKEVVNLMAPVTVTLPQGGAVTLPLDTILRFPPS
jgi:hypothetical protein